VIWLLRHGDAEPHGSDDASRGLTDKGKRQAANAGKAILALGIEIEICLASPKVRALQTAKIACEVLGMEPEAEEALRGGIFDVKEIAAGRDALLVGHEPDMSGAVAELSGGRVKLKNGGLAGIEPGTLLALFRPKDLTAIAKSAS
jgi:phosphohistidine phosphatase